MGLWLGARGRYRNWILLVEIFGVKGGGIERQVDVFIVRGGWGIGRVRFRAWLLWIGWIVQVSHLR